MRPATVRNTDRNPEGERTGCSDGTGAGWNVGKSGRVEEGRAACPGCAHGIDAGATPTAGLARQETDTEMSERVLGWVVTIAIGAYVLVAASAVTATLVVAAYRQVAY